MSDMTLEDQVYELMDWARIEAVVYSEEDQPHEFLGAHVIEEGILVQAFLPDAQKVWVKMFAQEKRQRCF